MTTNALHEVDPNNTKNIYGRLTPGSQYVSPITGGWNPLPKGPDPANNFYPTEEDTRQPQWHEFWDGTISKQFVGGIQQPDGKVVETKDIQPLSLDDTYQAKLAELDQITQTVFEQGTDVTLNDGKTYAMRTAESAFRTYVAARHSLYPDITTTRDKDVFNAWFQWTLGDVRNGGNVFTGMFLHFAGTQGNSFNHADALADLYAVGDRQGIIDYDLSAGWPPLPTSNGARRSGIQKWVPLPPPPPRRTRALLAGPPPQPGDE